MYRIIVFILTKIFFKISIRGKSKVPKNGPLIVICNHVSYLDAFLLAIAIPRPMYYVMDHIYYKGIIRKLFFKTARVFPIASTKENPIVLKNAYSKINKILEKEAVLCIFPEGTLTPDGKVHEFKSGILKIIEDRQLAILPVAINGLWGSTFSRNKNLGFFQKIKYDFRNRITINIGEPIFTKNTVINLAYLKDKVETLTSEI